MGKKVKDCLIYIKNITIENRFILCLAVPFLFMDIILRTLILDIDFFPAYYPAPNMFTLSWIVLFIGLIASLKGFIGRFLYWLIFTLSFAMLLVNSVYFSMTDFCFSFTLLELSGEGSAYIMDAILGMPWWNWLLLLLALVIGILIFILYIKKVKLQTNNWKRLGRCIIIFIILHILAVVVLGPKNSELKWNTFKNPRNVYDDFSDSNKCMKVTGLYEYTLRNIYVTFFKPEEVISAEDKEFLDAIYSEENQATESIYTGMFEGKNVIFLQLEGIDSWLLTEETMPNLYALQKQSINFKNHYSMYTGGGSTFNSEFAVNTGFTTPMSYIENVYSFHKNSFDYSMARLFKNLGYTVNAFHMNSGEFYSRGVNYNSWGYDNYYGLIDVRKYKNKEHYLDRELILNSTFYNEMFKRDDKFVHYIITYSAHTPFSVDKEVAKMLAEEKYGKDNIPQLTEEECAKLQAGETDYFIGLLMDALKENGLYENTVIVAYADHYLYTLEDKTILDQYKVTENNLINHTPFFIWSSDVEPENKYVVTMQTDILPTVLNLFGIEYNSNHYLGNDALANGYKGYVFFSDYSWYDGNIYVENGEVTYGGTANQEYIDMMSEKIGSVIRKNDLTLRYNYFKDMAKQKKKSNDTVHDSLEE
ncbi:MAG: sulfatase-like hydrolase/transferase [Lachnospiraceae bacterium]|nr:sulfatase-like hydrolase/transferase [Lachnospiraceae bacterium]